MAYSLEPNEGLLFPMAHHVPVVVIYLGSLEDWYGVVRLVCREFTGSLSPTSVPASRSIGLLKSAHPIWVATPFPLDCEGLTQSDPDSVGIGRSLRVFNEVI